MCFYSDVHRWIGINCTGGGGRWGGKEAETIDQSWDTKSRVGRLETFGCCCQSRSKKYEKYKERKKKQNITELEYVEYVTLFFVHTYIHTQTHIARPTYIYIHTIYTYIHTQTHIYMSYLYIHIHHIYIHTYIHT